MKRHQPRVTIGGQASATEWLVQHECMVADSVVMN